MKYKWLNQKDNSEIIIFFNGWGMDEDVVKHLGFENYDVLMFYDYKTLDTEFEFSILKSYSKRYLVSWSMGVMIASIFKENLGSLEYSTALNGTLKPIDKTYGINPKIYDLTIKLFNKEGREKFIKNMFNTHIKQYVVLHRTLEDQKAELEAIKNYSGNEEFKYDRVLISNDDIIIPTINQTKYWNLEPNIQGGHCVFPLFNSWKELL